MRDAATLPRYRAASIKCFPSGDKGIVYFLSSGAAHVLPANVASILDSCRSFRTLDEHVEHTCHQRNVDPDDSPLGESMFRYFLRSGFLVPEIALAPPRTDGHNSETTHRISSVGIVASQRLECLDRCLESYLANDRRFGRGSDFVVVDDSADAVLRRTRRQQLEASSHKNHAPISYAGAEKKERYIQALIEEGLPPSTVRFALADPESCGTAIGANRNALLLHHCGQLAFHADDDTVCRTAAPADKVDGLAFSPAGNPHQLWFFPDRNSAQDAATFAEADLLAEHEKLLGASVPEAIASAGGIVPGEGTEMSHEMFRLAQEGSGAGLSHVAITMSGLAGDSGFGSCSGLLSLDGRNRDRLLRTEHSYRMGTSSRQVIQMVNAPTLSDGSFCMSYAMGLDLRGMFPPFFPVGRNSDGILASVMRRCFTSNVFGHVPLAIVHDPPESRRYAPESVWRDASLFPLSSLVLHIIGSCEFGPVSDGMQRMRMLGRYLVEVSSASLAEFEEFVSFQVWKATDQRIRSLHGLLRMYGREPAYWAADCDRYMQTLLDSVTERGYVIPRDLQAGRSLDEARRLSQSLIRRYGELLLLWPDILETARLLRAKGIRLAEPV